MSWELIKELAEVCGTIGTAFIFFLRSIASGKLREEKMNAKILSMQERIRELQEKKADKTVTELHFDGVRDDMKRIREDLMEMRKENSHSIQRMAAGIEKLSQTVNSLNGTVQTALSFMHK